MTELNPLEAQLVAVCRAGDWILGAIILGWLCYGLGYWHGVLIFGHGPARDLAVIELPILALDKFLPIVDLGTSVGWRIDTTGVGGSLLRIFELAYMFAGWGFTALAAAALAGLIKKE